MGFADILLGEKAKIRTEEIRDPLKESAASPLSRFLTSEIGAGIPRFDAKTDTKGRILSDFPTDAEAFFNERIKGPALQTFREDLLPLVREDFAGSLSGSGRYRTEEEAASKFARGLADVRVNLEFAIKQENDKEALAQYQDWYKSLPINNPVLERSLSFLSEGTNTGRTVLSFLDQGREGIFGDIIGALAQIGGALAASRGE